VTNFVAQLEQEGLVEASRSPADPVPVSALPRLIEQKRPFVAPTLKKYSEIEDLLLLDPIHDVDDSGWPNRSAENPG
jgi:hypothetical protein